MAGKAKSSKKNPIPNPNAEDEQTLKSDIAHFTSSLFSSSGFNDSDFQKKGPLKVKIGKKQQNSDKSNGKSFNLDNQSPQFNKKENPNPYTKFKTKSKPKPPVLSTDETANGLNQKGSDKFKNLPKLPLVKASALGVWYVDLEELEKKVIGEGRGKKVEVKDLDEWKAFVEKKRELGERLMFQYARDYESSRGQSGDIKMLVATQRSGTAADKVSAFSVMVGDNPVANLRSLDGLLGLVTSKVGKRHALTGFEVLKELFVSSLLPDRKLKNLLQRPLRDVPETKDGYSLLLFWYWEESLKQRYERFIFALEEASRDMLPVLKDKALKTIYALLKSKSEQERKLLSALVNKLGDPQNKGASNADFHLSNLLSEHPNMKAVVIDEVDSFLFRPHLGLRAKYHAVNFLSQIRLSNRGDGANVAKRLIDVYFALFKVLITEAGGDKERKKHGQKDLKRGSKSKDMEEDNALDSHIELDSRILSVLLTGINRAFPYVSSNAADDIVEVQTPLLFQLVHSKNFNIGVQALMLLDKISSKNQVVSDRFYRALYSKLLLPAAMKSSKTEMFIGLLLRATKNDVNLKRVAAFSKRLLQIALQQPPQYACGYLFLLSEVLRTRPPLWNMMLQNESVDDELEHFEDVVEETENEATTVPKEQEDNVEPARSDDSDSDSASPHKDESPDTDSEDEVSDEADELLLTDASNDVQHRQIPDSKNQPKATPANSLFPAGYNPRHREPSYCKADRVSWWELTVLASHCHPSVAAMARTLLSGANIVYNGNPLNDLSLTAFLDKFMEKKPKQNAWHGGSQIEPAKKLDMNNHFIGPEILSLAEVDVPPEDVVFHKFYMNKMNSTRKQKKKKKKKGAEDEAAEELFDVDDGEKYVDEVDGGDESDNEEIENMMDAADVSSDGDGEYDYDDLDNVVNEDDDDLVANASDADGDMRFDIEDDDFDVNDADDDEGEDDDDIAIGDVDDGSDDEGNFRQKKGKRKSRGKKGESPFASLEEYEHLINEVDGPSSSSKNFTQKRSKSRKKRKPLK